MSNVSWKLYYKILSMESKVDKEWLSITEIFDFFFYFKNIFEIDKTIKIFYFDCMKIFYRKN